MSSGGLKCPPHGRARAPAGARARARRGGRGPPRAAARLRPRRAEGDRGSRARGARGGLTLSDEWGVRLERVGGALLIAPSGTLDGDEVDRLRRVLASRESTYECVVLDLRELAAIGAGGVELMRELRRHAQDVTFVGGPAAHDALREVGDDVVVEDDLDAVLARHR